MEAHVAQAKGFGVDKGPVENHPTTFIAADPTHPYWRPGDTHMFTGRDYVYFWAQGTHLLRRHILHDRRIPPVVVRCKYIPPHSLALTKKFSLVKRGLSVSVRKWRGKPHREGNMLSSEAPAVYDLDYLSSDDLQLIWSATVPDRSPPRLRDDVIAGLRTRLAELSIVPTNLMPLRGGGRQLRSKLWLVSTIWVPDTARRVHERSLPLPRGERITVLVGSNPKREGSGSARRFALYRTGMTVAEALATGVTSEDIRWDVSHSYIRVDTIGPS